MSELSFISMCHNRQFAFSSCIQMSTTETMWHVSCSKKYEHMFYKYTPRCGHVNLWYFVFKNNYKVQKHLYACLYTIYYFVFFYKFFFSRWYNVQIVYKFIIISMNARWCIIFAEWQIVCKSAIKICDSVKKKFFSCLLRNCC